MLSAHLGEERKKECSPISASRYVWFPASLPTRLELSVLKDWFPHPMWLDLLVLG